MSAGVNWRAFLRALAVEVDGQAGAAGREALLRATGRQMARLLALPAVASMEALEQEMNAVLADIGWGRTRMTLDETERSLILTHSDLPRLGSAGEPAGLWLAAALEGLYEGWLGQQPGADPSFAAHRRPDGGEGTVVIRYGRG